MPYQMPSDNILPGILSMMAAIKQGKIARQQRDQDTQYKQQQIADMQTTEKRTADQDRSNAILNGLDPQTGQPIPIPQQYMPQPNDDPKTAATKLIAAASYLDSKGARNLANQYRQTALAGVQVPYIAAGGPLRDSQTAVNKATVPLRNAQTVNTKANTTYTQGPKTNETNAQTKNILQIKPHEFDEQQQNENERQTRSLEAAQERAANAQAAAWDRMMQHFDFLREQQQHRDATGSKRSATNDTNRKNTAEAELLRSKVKGILKANPGASSDQIRAAAKKDGYSDAVIDLVLPPAKPAPKRYFSPSFIQNASNPGQ